MSAPSNGEPGGAEHHVLPEPVWRRRMAEHRRRVDGWLRPHLCRRRDGVPHPVQDFLFTYYSYRPARLRRWHPGAGVVLAGAEATQFGNRYESVAGGAALAARDLLDRRAEIIDWIRDLLVRTAARPAQLGCFGLHEWAMVYLQTPDQLRHAAWPLRLSPAETDRVVAERGVRCSHFDAFRFFTEPARPLNVLQPTRERQPELEQPGCLHATMDLYKWAYKLSPLVDSELVADCFELTRDAREIDMRASPYDLSALGYRPIAVETPAGRAEYVATQRALTERAGPLRRRLIAACDRLRDARPAALPTTHG